ncbi:uncharacterized protein PAC_18992 [Phialocephala subalpina]|uniref:Uncharacterized protein n=1 Tax=Phialocephala subalpina TaxID=576137 RepID=A0A1L7XVN6_9HELO|nr:uncharacterized protein PAC_18992 [Phialocephala subalpina]
MSTTRRATSMQRQTSINLHLPPTQASLRIQSMLKTFSDCLYEGELNIRDLEFRSLSQVYAIERHIRKLDEVIEERDIARDQRDEAEQTVARLREKAKEDRAEYAVLKKKLSEEKKSILEQCVAEKTKADQLSAKIGKLEKEKVEMEGRCERAGKTITINTTLCEALLKSETTKSQLSLENQRLRNENVILYEQNSTPSKAKDDLSASNTKWEEDNKQVMKDKIDSDAMIQHLNAQLDKREGDLRDLGNKVELWRQDVVHHQETNEQQKHSVNAFQREIKSLTRSNDQLQAKLSRVVARVIEAVADGEEPPQKRLKMSQTPGGSGSMRSPQSPRLNSDH